MVPFEEGFWGNRGKPGCFWGGLVGGRTGKCLRARECGRLGLAELKGEMVHETKGDSIIQGGILVGGRKSKRV